MLPVKPMGYQVSFRAQGREAQTCLSHSCVCFFQELQCNAVTAERGMSAYGPDTTNVLATFSGDHGKAKDPYLPTHSPTLNGIDSEEWKGAPV